MASEARRLCPETIFADKPNLALWASGPVLPSTYPKRRAFDLTYTYESFRPQAVCWDCIDLNTYDGSEGVGAFIGRGPTEGAARADLLGQFYEHDNPELPATSAERELDEAIDFDRDLEDRNER